MRLILAAATVLLIAGCADTPALVSSTAPTVVTSTDGAPLDTQTKVTCHKETAIGSQMIHTVCETEKTDAERQALQQRMRDNAGSAAAAHQGIGH